MKQWLVLASAIIVSPSLAQTKEAAPVATAIPQSPEHLAVADELMDAMGASRLQMSMIPQIVDAMMPLVLRGNEGHAEQVETILREEMTRAFASKRVAMLHASRNAYARHMTTAQLRDLVTFYRTPTGKRFVELQGTVVSEAMRDGQKIGHDAAMEAMPFVIERLRKAELKVPVQS